jgi:hypothetical protein
MKNRKILFEVAAIAMAAMVIVTGFTSCNKANAQTGGGSAASGGRASSKSAPKVEYALASDFAYDLNKEGDGIIVKRYTGTNSTLAIPAEIEGYPVTEIAGVFSSTNVRLVSVIIPKTVKTIGKAAFSETDLQHVDLSDTSLTSLEREVFYGCTSLQTVKLPDTLKTIGDAAFYKCINLQTITLPDTVEIIGEWAFQYCSTLTSDIIPASIKEIGNGAFQFCRKLTNLSIPDTITSVKIASDSFSGCGKLPIATRKRLQDLGYTGEF